MTAVASTVASASQSMGLRWCTIAPMPYWDDLFKRMSSEGVLPLSVVYLHRDLKDYPMLDMSSEEYASTSLESYFSTASLLLDALLRSDTVWLVGGWGAPKYVVLLLLLSLTRRRYYLFTDTPVPKGRAKSAVLRALRKPLLDYWFAHATGIIGTGKLAVTRLREMGATPEKLFSIPPPLDESRFSCGADRPVGSAQPIVIICSGRLHMADKRFDMAIRAFASVCVSVGPEVPCRLRIAGAGPDEKALRRLADDLHVADRVDFLGWLGQAQLAALYRSGDVYLHPTDFEPYGVTVVEALYSGLYIVASDGVGAAIELVEDGVNGTLFKSADLPALNTALLGAVDGIRRGSHPKAEVRAASLCWCMDRYIAEVNRVIR